MKINQIDLIELYQVGMTEKEAISKIKTFCKKYYPEEKVVLAGHNVSFDIAFLKKLFYENEENFSSLFHFRSIDTCSIMKYLYFSNKLPKGIETITSAMSYFNIKIDDEKRHTALYDALLTAEIFNRLTHL